MVSKLGTLWGLQDSKFVLLSMDWGPRLKRFEALVCIMCTLLLVREISNRDPACIFYEGIPGKDISGSELMLEQQQANN